MAFDLEGARKAGYSDAEIAEHLASSSKFDTAGAKSAGYSDGEIIAHLQGKLNIPKQRTTTEEIGRQVGLTARAGLQGAGGLAGLGADPIGAIINSVLPEGSPQAIPARELAKQLADMLGLPSPENATERVVGAGAEGMAGAGAGVAAGSVPVVKAAAPLVADLLAQGPLAQVLGGAGGGMGGEAAGEAGGGTAARIAASVAGGATAGSIPGVADAVTDAAKSAGGTIQRVATAAKSAAGMGAPDAPTPGTMGSVGAAGTDMATQRRQLAAALPEPIELTKGQATRDFAQQQFERETAKNAKAGAPLRERVATQNQQILNNMDIWVDQTGAQAPSLREAGAVVDKALVNKSKQAKAAIKAAYKAADDSPEASALVEMKPLQDLLLKSEAAEGSAPILVATKKELARLGGDDPSTLTIKTAEDLRKFINSTVKSNDGTDMEYARRLKESIDGATENAGGDLYRSARRLREQYGKEFNNAGVINKLLSTKPGTTDRSVAFEDVFDHAILRGSLDDVRTVRKVLQTAGPDGQQAWKELQGQTMQHIKDAATKNVARDERGNAIVSAAAMDRAIRALDADGKLQFVFGKQGAQNLRDLNDLAKVVYTSPPGSVNTSNTASIVTAAVDMMLSGSMGVPLPLTSAARALLAKAKNRKLEKGVEEALK